MNNYDIGFLSMLVPKSEEEKVLRNDRLHIHTLGVTDYIQEELVKGFKNNDCDVFLINKLHVGTFPITYKYPYVKSSNFTLSGECSILGTGFGFVNIGLITRFFLLNFAKYHLRKWATYNNHRQKIFLVYAFTNFSLKSIKYIKKINPNIRTGIIIPDLPEYMNTSSQKNPIKSFLRKFIIKYTDSLFLITKKKIDYYFLFSEHMHRKLNCSNSYCVIEGIATDLFPKVSKVINDKHKEEIIIMYAGGLQKKYGILNLLEAFSLIEDQKYRLLICGDGDGIEQVLEYANKDERINYLGRIDRARVLTLMLNATVLINPRQNNEEFIKYSFPSKTLEYLSSGIPLVGYKLDCFPEEYDAYINYVEGHTTKDLADKIVEICSKSAEELKEIGEKSKEFVLSKKNGNQQARKIINFINGKLII